MKKVAFIAIYLLCVIMHKLIDALNPSLRSVDEVDGKQRIREFYAMTPEEALKILKMIATVNGLEENITVYNQTAEEIRTLSANRHHFREIEFISSLTNKRYYGGTGEDGTLKITDTETGIEIPNNAKPSKKAIIGQAILDLGGETSKDETLYQRYRKLTKLILSK